MVCSPPGRARQSYRHEALLWHGAADYTAALVPFLEDGLAAGEPTMVAAVPEHLDWLRDGLGPGAEAVTFVDMQQLGANPARILPAWQQFLDAHSGRGRPVRGIGEPVWPGRRAEELAECQLHEALLNVAIDPDLPFWLICPYDAEQLAAEVLDEASRSHPVILEADSYHGSGQYEGRAHVDSLFAAPLADLTGEPRTVTFADVAAERLQHYLQLEFHVAGLPADRSAELAGVVQQLVGSSLQRGAAGGTIRIGDTADGVVCEVTDDSVVGDLLLGRRVPFEEEHDALWRANQLCDLVQLRSTGGGTAVRLHTWT